MHEEISNEDETSLIPENIICIKTENRSEGISCPNNEIIISSERKRKSSLDSQKHCDNCEIVFNYEHSLAAHRKFYCKGDKRSTPPNTNVVSIPVAEASALLLK